MTAPREMAAAEIVFHASPCEPVEDRTRIHAWLIDVGDVAQGMPPDRRFPSSESYLSTEEQARAGRIRDPRKRGIWRQSRMILRHILGLCVDTPPRHVRFATGAQGKPTIVDPECDQNSTRRVEFNLSHSGDALLIGVSFDANIGVDIEVIDADLDVMALAEAHFSPAETRQLASLRAPERQLAFFRCWALKEAALKAQGLGIAAGFDAIEFRINSSSAPRIVKNLTSNDGAGDAVYQSTVTLGEGTAAAAIYTRRARVPGTNTKSRD